MFGVGHAGGNSDFDERLSTLNQYMDPDHGLLEELNAAALLDRNSVKAVQSKTYWQKKNKIIVKKMKVKKWDKNGAEFGKLVQALRNTCQGHLVNYLTKPVSGNATLI